MKAIKLSLGGFRLFNEAEIYVGKRITAIAGNNGTGKSTILGLLANSSALKKKKSLLDKPYRGEFPNFSAQINFMTQLDRRSSSHTRKKALIVLLSFARHGKRETVFE